MTKNEKYKPSLQIDIDPSLVLLVGRYVYDLLPARVPQGKVDVVVYVVVYYARLRLLLPPRCP